MLGGLLRLDEERLHSMRRFSRLLASMDGWIGDGLSSGLTPVSEGRGVVLPDDDASSVSLDSRTDLGMSGLETLELVSLPQGSV